MNYPHKIAKKTSQYYWSLLFCLPWIIMGVFLLFNQAPHMRVFTIVSAIVNLVFFGGGAILVVKQLQKSGSAILVDTTGIHDNVSFLKERSIPWEDILEIRSGSTLGTKYLLIDVRNPEDYINSRSGGIVKSVVRTNANIFGTPIYIPTSILEMPHDEIIRMMQQELKQFRALPDDLLTELSNPIMRDIQELKG